jgi:hypothetical protein
VYRRHVQTQSVVNERGSPGHSRAKHRKQVTDAGEDRTQTVSRLHAEENLFSILYSDLLD